MAIYEAAYVGYAFKTYDQVMAEYAKVKNQKAKEAEAVASTGKPYVMLNDAELEEMRHAVNITKAAIHPDT